MLQQSLKNYVYVGFDGILKEYLAQFSIRLDNINHGQYKVIHFLKLRLQA